jgi:hypothetical protein
MEVNTMTQDLSGSWADEARGLELVNLEFEELLREHPNWFHCYEDAAPLDLVTRAELGALAATAPNGFARGLIYSILAMRVAFGPRAAQLQ